MSFLMSGGAVITALMLWLNREHATMIILPFAGLLLCLLYPDTLWTRLFRHPLLQHLDKLSLGIYMNHVLFMHVLNKYPQLTTLGLPTDLLYLAVVAGFSAGTIWIADRLLKKIKGRNVPSRFCP